MKALHNIKKFYYYSIFKEALIIGPIVVLFLLKKGLNMTQIMSLQAIFSFSIFVLEVPTGAIADRFGRKYSLFLGTLFITLGLIIYIVGSHFIVFLCAEIMFSFGLCFKSGADSALLYDSLISINREKEFKTIFGKGQSLVFYVQAVGSIAASLLFTINVNLPFIISCFFMLTAGVIALSFKEIRIQESGTEDEKYFELIKGSFTYIIGHKKILAVTFFALSFYIFYRNSFWFYTPYFKAVDIPTIYYGTLFFIFNMVAAFFSKRVDQFIAITKPKTMISINALLIISFITLGAFRTPLAVIFILLQQITRGVYKPVLNKYINKHTKSNNRATVLSFISLITNLSVAIIMPFSGFLVDHFDIFHIHLLYGGIMMITTFMLNQYLNKTLGKQKNQIREKIQ